MDDMQARVIECIAKEVRLDPKLLTPTATFDELGIDSLDVVNIVFALEDEFGLQIPDEFNLSDLEDIAGVHRAVAQFVAAPNNGPAHGVSHDVRHGVAHDLEQDNEHGHAV